MKDSAGVNRGYCKDCVVAECSDYKIQKNTFVCRYCGCYPVMHACEDPGEDKCKQRNKIKILEVLLIIGTLSSARRQALERQRHRKETGASMGKPHKTLCVLVVDLDHANLTSW